MLLIYRQINQTSSSRVLEHLHLDPKEPLQTKSLGGKRYVMVIVDDCSRYMWVRFLREKSEAFIIFHALCLQLQREKDLKVKWIRSDHGKEFENMQFAEFCALAGIHHEFQLLLSKMKLLCART